MRKNVCFFLLSILLLVACQSHEMRALHVVNGLLDSGNLDSARVEMSKILYGKLSSDESKAYYPLLKAKIAYLRNIPFKDSLLLNNSIEYFWQNSKLFLLSDAYYYKGCLEFQEKHYDSAFFHMKQAEYYSDKTNDVNQKLKIVQMLLEFNNLIGDKEYVNIYSRKKEILAKNASSKVPSVMCLSSKVPLLLSERVKKRIYLIQKTFTVEADQKLKDNTMLNVFISIIVLFVVLTYLLYGRNKIAENKLLLEKEMTHEIKDAYEVKIRQLWSDKEKTEQKLEKMKGNILEREMEVLSAGKILFQEIQNGGTTAVWNKRNFEEFNEYYKLVNSLFIEKIKKEFSPLSPQCVFYLIMRNENRNEEEIMRVLCKTNGALRTMKSRINAKKI